MAESGAESNDAELHEAEEPEEGHHRLPHPEVDLVKLAALLRRAIPIAPDDEARERLESAWVSVTNAVKQPKADAARLRRRLRRLREELEHMLRQHTGGS
ncbi:MAG: hypothetical protein H6525_05785 [Actinobacteria bacterium]|nr:hypothetical protein [Actinomycetota bacterium]